jgi:hypothetical protein
MIKQLKLHQEGYVLQLLEEFDMMDCNSTSTPLCKGVVKLWCVEEQEDREDTKKDLEDRKKFQSVFGKLMWLGIKTRPDLSFTVNFFSRMLKVARKRELQWITDRPLRYLNGTRNYGLVFCSGQARDQKPQISGASDADLGGDKSSRSTMGGYLKLGQMGTIIYTSKLLKTVCTSTGQAETGALNGLCKDEVWCRRYLEELGEVDLKAAMIDVDNAGVVKQSMNPINHGHAKHYRLQQAYIRQLYNNGEVTVLKVNSEDNAGDFFTKALDKRLFVQHRDEIMGAQVKPGSS